MGQNRFEGILWDMDGVLVDTSEAHYLAWQHALASFDRHITREEFLRTFGRNNDDTIKMLMGDVPDTRTQTSIISTKEQNFRQLVRGRVRLLPGVLDWLQSFHEQGILQAVASSAPQENIEAIVGEAGISDFFAALVCGDTLPSKPQPDIFLAAARMIDVTPRNCLVIEDSPAGVEAAKTAGMACLAVVTSHSPADLAAADFVLTSLAEMKELPK